MIQPLSPGCKRVSDVESSASFAALSFGASAGTEDGVLKSDFIQSQIAMIFSVSFFGVCQHSWRVATSLLQTFLVRKFLFDPLTLAPSLISQRVRRLEST